MAALAGRTAIVTGAGRGIGAACARALDAAGARVALVARSVDELEATASKLINDPVVVQADLGTPDGPSDAVATALAAFDGRLDVLVNNAGMGLRKELRTYTVDELDRMWNVNVRSALLLTAAAIGPMLDRRSGSIINVSSISGRRGAPHRAAYSATKAALDGMVRSLAMEYGPQGIRANAIAPGVVETDMWTSNLAMPGVEDDVLGVIPIRRISAPDEIADVVVFLASDAASSITGEVISVDGGMHGTVNLWPKV